MIQLSKRAETILKLAKEIAAEYRQRYVGTEHLLLAILREGTGSAADILQDHGVDDEQARQEIDKLLRARMQETWVLGRVPGSPHFRDVLSRAAQEARGAGNWQIGSIHLLLGLLAEKGSVGHNALRAMDITTDTVRRHLLQAGAS